MYSIDLELLCRSLNASNLKPLISRYVVILDRPEPLHRWYLLSSFPTTYESGYIVFHPSSNFPIPASCRPIIQPHWNSIILWYIFNISVKVKITDCDEWALNSHSENILNQNTCYTDMSKSEYVRIREPEYITLVEISNLATFSINTHSFSKRNFRNLAMSTWGHNEMSESVFLQPKHWPN